MITERVVSDCVHLSPRLAWYSCAALVTVLSSVALSTAGQDPSRARLAAIRRMRCVFSVAAVGAWEGPGTRAQVSSEGVLSLQIVDIDTEDGSARIQGATGTDSHVVARLSDQSLHFMETDVTGSLLVTTVFAHESRPGKLKAVHSRTSFLPVELPGFSAEPSASQYYGECEATR